MGKIILITGGSRSGKSDFAQKKAEETSNSRLYIATCPPLDSELEERIKRHQAAREGLGWQTVEEQLNISDVIEKNEEYSVILIDCLTLWINNIQYKAEVEKKCIDENHITEVTSDLIDICKKTDSTIFFVTNEVGSGIVPESAETRLYRDLVGRCNQYIGAAADEVFFVTCSVPLQIK